MKISILKWVSGWDYERGRPVVFVSRSPIATERSEGSDISASGHEREGAFGGVAPQIPFPKTFTDKKRIPHQQNRHRLPPDEINRNR